MRPPLPRVRVPVSQCTCHAQAQVLMAEWGVIFVVITARPALAFSSGSTSSQDRGLEGHLVGCVRG